ncbi:hypothetical protein Nepgr_031683 [Nepenthes gracilis]|uniref:Protein arginine N-methyltransferase domain-containing protein n=1 Tax=Nepenthes gracilis TaxID=150966 RepID=A0AAD3TH72_NEPGR|nr:hypothetical protein Nepgr_031683 [Nepenthes gracilis]
MSSVSAHRIFQLKLDPLTGKSEWVIIDENDDASQDPAKPDLVTTSYLDMLNDTWRNRAFQEAIDKTLTKPFHVLDIGAGTGLLSMMAARAMGLDDRMTPGSIKGMVTACESFLPMLKLMRKVLHVNGMERKINVINKRSDELKVGVDINSRADVLVSEILDSELLGEGLIPTLQNAHDMLLVDNPRTVPYRAMTYGQLVESTFLWKLQDLYNNEMKASDGIHLVPTGLETILRVKRQQYPMHSDPLKEGIKLLSEPFKIFEFDFWKRPDSHGETDLVIKASDDGRVNAVISWWVLQLDYEGTIFYSTAPKWIKDSVTEFSVAGNWCDHWKQCVWFIPGKGESISKGEEIHLHAVHSDISISYDLKTQTPRSDSRQLMLQDGFHLVLSPEKIALYGDAKWRQCMFSAIQNVLQGKDSPVCVVADDSVFLATLISHLSKTAFVTSLFPGLREKGLKYLQAIAEANGISINQTKVFSNSNDCLTMYNTTSRKVDLLVGEPFYYGHEGRLPWQNLRFWKDRTVLDEILSKDALVIPCKGILMACAMFLPDLWRSRCSLGKIEGFDHTIANSALGACGNFSPPPHGGPCLPFFVWQCGQIKELSERFAIMEFDFLKPMSSCSGKAKVDFSASGICHGFVFWIDWVLDIEGYILVSSGPDNRFWKQGVKLLAEPMAVGPEAPVDAAADEYKSAEIEAFFDSSSGDLVVQHSFVR